MKTAKDFERLLFEDKKTNYISIYRNAIQKELDELAKTITNDDHKNFYKKNPLLQIGMGTQFSKDPLLRRTIVDWLKYHGYICFWDNMYESYCVYLPSYKI